MAATGKAVKTKKSGKKRTNIDGGFAWVIVAACFVVHMLQVGFLRAFGLLFVKFLDEFKAPASLTSTVMGIESAIFSLSSMIVLSILLDYWSIRVCAMVGAFLAALGVAISCLAINVEFLIFSIGLLPGVGFAMTYGPGIVLIGRYFKKRVALANAVANCGVSAGAVVMPILITHIMDVYGFRGSLLVLGGVMSQVIICTAFYREPIQQDDVEKPVNVEEFKSLESFYSVPLNDKNLMLTPQDAKCSPKVVKIELDFRERTYSNRSQYSDIVRPKDVTDSDGVKLPKQVFSLLSTDCGNGSPRHRNTSESRSIVDSLSRSKVLMYASNPSLMCASVIDLKQKDEICDKTDISTVQKPYKGLSKIKNILDIRLFKNPVFWIIAAYTPIGMTGSALGAAYIPAIAQEYGLSESQGALLLTVSGGLDIISRLVPGIIAEFKLIKNQYMVVMSLLILGTIFQFVMYFNTYPLLMVFCCLYGLLGGVYFSLLAVVLMELMGLENFPKVFGFVQVFQGASAAICYPVLGGLRDITGTYVTCFQFLGACMIIGALILSLEPLARKRYNAQQESAGVNVTEYSEVPTDDLPKNKPKDSV